MAKTVRKTTNDAVTRAAQRSARTSPPATNADTDVAARAYARFLARGGEHGHDVDDWLEAERDLQSDMSVSST
jgi:hypothetical protein